jgi:hypothetical protein
MEGGDDYDPRIVNPTILEGIELVYNSLDKLVEFHVSNEPKSHLLDKMILLRTEKKSGVLSVLVFFEKSQKVSDAYNIKLLTQLKGPEFVGSKVGGRSITITKRITI